MFVDSPDRFGNLVHVTAAAQEHRLCEPHRFLAELIVGRALVAFFPAGEQFRRINL